MFKPIAAFLLPLLILIAGTSPVRALDAAPGSLFEKFADSNLDPASWLVFVAANEDCTLGLTDADMLDLVDVVEATVMIFDSPDDALDFLNRDRFNHLMVEADEALDVEWVSANWDARWAASTDAARQQDCAEMADALAEAERDWAAAN